jgi:hypothetical protein
MTRYLLAIMSMLGAVALLSGSAQAGQCPKANKATEDGQLIVRTYDVTNLVADDEQTAVKVTLKILRQSIDPPSWQECGGPAHADYFPVGKALIVRQTSDNHKKMAGILDAARRLQPVEVGVDVQLVSLSPDTAKQFTYLVDFQLPTPEDPLHDVEAALLNAPQRRAWMTLMQSDRSTSSMQAPTVRLCNGQYGAINVMDELEFLDGDASAPTVGLHVDLLPIVSTKRQDVLLFLDLAFSGVTPVDAVNPARAVQKLSLVKMLAIPNGTTLVCKLGNKLVQTQNVCDTPLWSVPGDFEVFCRTVTREVENREVFLLITPRVIVNDDK